MTTTMQLRTATMEPPCAGPSPAPAAPIPEAQRQGQRAQRLRPQREQQAATEKKQLELGSNPAR